VPGVVVQSGSFGLWWRSQPWPETAVLFKTTMANDGSLSDVDPVESVSDLHKHRWSRDAPAMS